MSFIKNLFRRRRRDRRQGALGVETVVAGERVALQDSIEIPFSLTELVYFAGEGEVIVEDLPGLDTFSSLQKVEEGSRFTTADGYKIITNPSWLEFKRAVEVEGLDLGQKLHVSLSMKEGQVSYINDEVWADITEVLSESGVNHFKIRAPSSHDSFDGSRQPGKDLVIYLSSVDPEFNLGNFVTALNENLTEQLGEVNIDAITLNRELTSFISTRNDQGPIPYELGNTELNYINASRGEHEIFARKLQETFTEEYPDLQIEAYDPIGSLFFCLRNRGFDLENSGALVAIYEKVINTFVETKIESGSVRSESNSYHCLLNLEEGRRNFTLPSSEFGDSGYLYDVEAREICFFSTLKCLREGVGKREGDEDLSNIVRKRIDHYERIMSLQASVSEVDFNSEISN